MKKITISFLALISLNSFAVIEPIQKTLVCRATLPILFAPKSVVTLASSNSIEGVRKITFQKNKSSKVEEVAGDCLVQASFLTCRWKTGNIAINISRVLEDDGIAIGGSTVGGYDYFEATTTIKRMLVNKSESVRCRIIN